MSMFKNDSSVFGKSSSGVFDQCEDIGEETGGIKFPVRSMQFQPMTQLS
jgi:hypothetical protein